MLREPKYKMRINDKMEFLLEEGGLANALVQEVGGNQFSITIPVARGSYKFLEQGAIYEVILYNGKQTYGLRAKLMGKKTGNIPMYVLKVVKELGQVQRRENVRVPTNLNFVFSCNENLLKLEFDNDHYVSYKKQLGKYLSEGIILDISAGGINFSAREKFRVGCPLLLFIEFEDLRFMTRGIVRYHRYRGEQGGLMVNNYGVEFTGLDSRFQEEIVKRVFKMMRKVKDL